VLNEIDGKTISITGASEGIGAAAAPSLVSSGNRVVLVRRSPSKTKPLSTSSPAFASRFVLIATYLSKCFLPGLGGLFLHVGQEVR
jgi:NADP-dependent 3-hydroxy acid dehydrogenase YdfG